VKDLEVRRLGRVPYAEALELQRTLVEDRRAGRIGDVLLLLEHPHVITLGTRCDLARSNVLATPARLAELGVEMCETGRGGDVTYHGPGQLVAYPILNLKPDRADVYNYVRNLEQVMIAVSRTFGVEAGRIEGLTGAWVGGSKIGAIGVRISRWISSHGFAYNVNADLAYFDLIVPCGIRDHGVTSLARELGHRVDLAEVEEAVVSEFSQLIQRS
jgi:lipoyl(octanoyl) transferase